MPDLENKINTAVLKQIEEDRKIRIQLDTISSFEWDELIIVNPYTNMDNINGYDLSAFPSIATDYDQFLFFGFLSKKKGVKFMSLNWNKLFDQLQKKSSNGYSIYPKAESKFELSE